MTYSVLIFAYRKPGTTPEQFRAHYEGKHVPLVKEIGGEYVPAPAPGRHFTEASNPNRTNNLLLPDTSL